MQIPAVRVARELMIALALSCFAPAANAAQAADLPPPIVKRGFVDMRWGQIHYRIATPRIPALLQKTPLVLFHQSPLSSLEYGPLIAEMGRDRVVVALDTPGQGGSDTPSGEVSISAYAAEMVAALKTLGFGPHRPFDLLGNHTGTSIAMEAALLEPDMVRQIVMTGMYMAPESQIQGDIDALTFPETSVAAFAEMCRQTSAYSSRTKMDARADAIWGELAIDSWRPLQRREDVHKAAFLYHKIKKERIAKIQQKVWMIGLNDPLLRESTQQSLKMFKNIEYVDLTEFKLDVFRAHPKELSAALRERLL